MVVGQDVYFSNTKSPTPIKERCKNLLWESDIAHT